MPYETSQDITYRDAIVCVKIPAGFPLDFASVPRFLQGVFPQVGRYCRAALVHDALYRDGLVGRSVADALFLEIMRGDGVDRLTRWAMYSAVRCFGWVPWRDLRRGRTSLGDLQCLVEHSSASDFKSDGGMIA